MKTIAIVANLVLAIAAIGFGNLLRSLIPRSFSRLDRVALILQGGLGLLGTILFCVGQVWFSRSSIILVLLAGVLLSLRPLWVALHERRPAWTGSLPALPAAIILLSVLLAAVGGLALPTGDMNNDAIAYHYPGPKAWLREGLIRPVPDEVLTYFPVVVESQYAALMSIGGQRAPGFFTVIALGVLLLTTASLAIRLGLDSPGACWAAALVATMPAVMEGTYGGFIDAAFASFVLGAARLALDAEEPEHFALFGILAGIAMGTKYTGIVAWGLLVFCAALIFFCRHRRKTGFLVKWLGVSCAIAALVASPSYLRNWILYGCPIYPPPPALLRFFTPKHLLPAVMAELLRNVRDTGRGMGGGVLNFLLLPFHLTYHTANFRGAGGIGLAPFALAPFGVIARRRERFAQGILLFAIFQTGAWFVTAQVSRYLIHVYVIAAIFAVIGWKYATDVSPRNGRILSAAVIALSVLYGLWMIASMRIEDVHATISPSFEESRQYRETAFAASFDYINHEPSVKKVLILNAGVSDYFIDKSYVKPFGRWGEQTLGARNVPEAISLLPDLHATHVLDVKDDGGDFALPQPPSNFTLVFERGNQRIYRID